MARDRRRFKYVVSPLEALVLLQNILNCPDAENDADRTVWELVEEIDTFDGYLSRMILESALYCCNINDEDKKFWHPRSVSFQKFVVDLLPIDQEFDRNYNIIKEKEKANGPNAKNRR